MSLIVKTENDLKVSCKIVLYDESFDFSSFKSIGYVYIFYEKSLNLYQFIASIFANQNFLKKIWQKSTQKLIKKKSPFFHFFLSSSAAVLPSQHSFYQLNQLMSVFLLSFG